MTLKWSHVDLAERVLRLPDSKSGARVVHLGQPAVELLRDAQHIEGNPWIIAGRGAYAGLVISGASSAQVVIDSASVIVKPNVAERYRQR